MARARRSAAAAKDTDTTKNGDTDDAAAKESATKKAQAERQAKREAQAAQDAQLTETLLEEYGHHPAVVPDEEKTETIAAVAKRLNITTTKALWLLFFAAVDQGKVPAIKAKDDDALVQKIHEARKKADRFSAWGWLAARSGKSETWIKTKLGEAGLYSPREENIASVRSEAKPKPEPKVKTADGEKKPGRTRRRGNAS